MRKIIKYLCLILLVLTTITISSCGTKVYELDQSKFNNIFVYNSTPSYEGLNIVSNKDNVIPVTQDMINGKGIDTSSVGEKHFTVSYDSLEFRVKYYVKYKVTFDVLGDKTDQLVYDANDISKPTLPTVEGQKFSHFEPEIPTNLIDNMDFKAVYISDKFNIPALNNVYNVEYNDTLADITLPSNEYGHWEFVDASYTFNQVKELYLNVKFIPNDSSIKVTTSKIKINVTKKLVEFTNVCDTYTYDGLPHKVTYNLPDGVKVIEVTNDSYTEVGTYYYEIKVFDDNYKGGIAGKLTINKAKVNITLPNIVVNYTQGYRLTLDEIINHPDFKCDITNINDLNLSLVESFSNIGTYEYKLTSDNKNYDITFTKGTITIKDGNLDLTNIPLPKLDVVTYGDIIGDIKFLENSDFHVLGNYTYLEPTKKVDNVGSYDIKVLFTPNDSNYSSVERVVTVNVNKKVINLFDYLTKSDFNYDGFKHSLEFNTTDLTSVVFDGNTPEITSGSYVKNIVVVSDFYEGSAKITLKINKVNPNFVLPTGLTAIFTNQHNVLDLGVYDNGTLELLTPNAVFDKVGVTKVNVKFTPFDQVNYNIVDTFIEVNVTKAETVINALDYTGDYNGLPYTPKANINHNETKLNMVITKDNKVVNEIKDAGVYTVTYTSEETLNYSAATKTITVTINKINHNAPIVDLYKATYGDTLESIELESTKDGSYVWANPTLKVGNAGLNTHIIKFIPTNNNYKETEYTVKVNVSKKTLTFNITKDTFDYDGLEHKLEYSLPVQVTKVMNADESYINAGIYSITLTIVDDNYNGSITHNLTINKVTPKFELPNNLTLKYNENINTLVLPTYNNGTLTFNNNSQVMTTMGVNKVKATFTPNDQNNYYTLNNVDVIVNVIKADVIINCNGFNATYNGLVHDLKVEVIPEPLPYTISYNLDGRVVNEIKEAGKYTIDITVNGNEFYNEKTIQVIVNISKKDANNPNQPIRAEYDTTLADITFETIEGGKWEWVNPTHKVGNVGRNVHQAKFVPSSPNYTERILDVQIDVYAKVLTFTNVRDTFDYNGKSQTVLYDLPVTVEVRGNVTLTNAGKRSYTLMIYDTNYTGSYSGELVINKINPTFNLPEGLTATYNDQFNKVNLGTYTNGTLTFDTPDSLFTTIGTSNYNVTFTPNDLNNYNVVKTTVSVTVNKAKPVITANGFVADYNHNKHDFTASVDNNESALKYKYMLNGKLVNEIKESGTYTVTIYTLATAHYEASEVTVTVTINKINPTNPTKLEYNATYDDLLSTIALENNDVNGSWVWVNPTNKVGDAGRQTHQIKFVPTDLSYNEVTVDVTVIVAKKVLTFNITKDTYTYDDTAKKLEYTLPYPVAKVNGNAAYTTVGTYSITLIIIDNNYEGTITHNLVINKANPNFDLPLNLTATYGDLYSSLKLGTYVDGKLEFDTPNARFELIGTNEYKVTYTPNDLVNFDVIHTTVKVTVNKANTIIDVKDYVADYKPGYIHSVNASVNHNEGELVYEYKLNGQLVTEVLNAGTYTLTVSMKETAHYKAASVTVNVQINKLNPEFTTPSNLTATYGQTYDVLNLGTYNNGSITLDNPKNLFNTIGSVEVTAKFIPTDSVNYNVIPLTLRVTVRKDTTVITANGFTEDYNSNVHLLNVSLNHNEAKYNIEYLLNGQKVTEIRNAGTYKVTINVAETAHYTGATKVITVVINKINPTFNLPEGLTATYNDQFNKVNLGTYTNGTLTFDTPDSLFTTIGTSNYNVTFTPNDLTNYNVVKTTVSVTVNKAKPVITAKGFVDDYNHNKHEFTASVDNSESLLQYKYMLNGKLVNEIKAAGTYTVTIYTLATAHYEASEVTVTVTINKINPTNPTKLEYNATYDDLLSTIALENNDVNGTWVWVNPTNKVGDAGRQTHQIKFVPTDLSYNEVTVDVTVIVAKKVLTFNITKDTYTYDGTAKKLEYTLPVNSLNVGGNNSYINAGTYSITLIINDNNYEGTITHNLVIKKANPVFDLPLNLTSTYGNTYSSVDLGTYANGTLEFDTPNAQFEIIGNSEYAVTFMPKDGANYNVLKLKVTINVEKANTVLTANGFTKEYDGQVHTVTFNRNHNESNIQFEYLLNGLTTTEIKNAGKYQVTVISPESSHYKEARTVVEVIITPKASVNPDSTIAATFGTKLADITFNQTVGGVWSWVTPEATVGNVGVNVHRAKFTATDPNYQDKEIDITITVTPKKLDFTITNNTFTFEEGIYRKVEYTLPVSGLKVVGEVSQMLPGEYPVTLRIDELNYEGSITTTLVIKKAKLDVVLPVGLTGIYGNEYQSVQLPKYNNGTLTYETPNTKFNSIGLNKIAVVFTPNETDKYEINNYIIDITVDRAETIITANGFVADYSLGKVHNIDATYNHNEGVLNKVIKYNNNIVTEITNAGTYKVEFTIEQTEHYKRATKVVEVIINKINPIYTLPQGLTMTYGQTYGSLTLESLSNGRFEIVNPTMTFDKIGNNTVNVKFIPNDLTNYNIVTDNIIVNVVKINTTITASDVTADYNGKTYNVDAKTNNVESTLTYTYELLNGQKVTEIRNAGTYKVTINVAESAHYTAATKVITVVINKINPTFNLPEGLTATYNDQFNKVNLGTYTNGTLTLDTPDSLFTTIGTSNYNVTFTPNDLTNYNVVKTTVSVTVNKAKPVITANGFVADYNHNKHDFTASVDNNESLLQYKYMLNGKLVNEIKAAGTYTVTIYTLATAHYEASEVTVTVTINKINPTNPTKLEYNATYDDLLSTITLENNDVNGSWVWVNPTNKVGNAGRQTHQIKFVPTDLSYNEVTIDVTVIVAKKVLTFNITKDTYTYDGTAKKLEYTLPVNSLNVGGNNSYINAGTYSITLIINDNNYEGTVTHNLVINKANPVFDLPLNLTATYGDKYSSVDLGTYANGTLEFVDPNLTFSTVGNVECDVVFTPNDLTNYNVVYNKVIVSVSKITTIIHNNDVTYDYNGNPHTIKASFNHNEQTTIEYTIKFNNNIVTEIRNAGVYSVTITVSATTNYTAATKTITVTINKINPTDPNYTVNATYTDLLSSVQLPQADAHGHYEWVNPNSTVGDVGTHTHKMKYVCTDSNYNDTEFNVTITVSKKVLTFTITNDTFTYNGLGHSLEYQLPVLGLKVDGNTEEINAGTYSKTLTINDLNYEGTITHDLVIIKANPTHNLPEKLDVIVGTKANTLDLSKYVVTPSTIKFVDQNLVFNTKGQKSYDLIITPTDNVNYNTINVTLNINVMLKKTEITGYKLAGVNNKLDATYSGQEIVFEVTTNSNGRVEYIITKDGVASAILNAGVYNVEVRIAESNEFEALTKTYTITINKKQADDIKVVNYTGTYGDKLESILLDNNNVVGGTWSWVNPTAFVGNAGATHQHEVVFNPTNTNYETRTMLVNVTVNKKTLEFTNVKNVFNYDGNAHTVEYTLSEKVQAVNGNITLTNVGSKAVTLVINDPNYAGTLSTTLTINKGNPTFTLPTDTKVVVGTNVVDLVLPTVDGGRLVLTSALVKFDTVGVVDLDVKFIPNDTTNYLEVNTKLKVTVTKLIATITYNGITSTKYNGSEFVFNATLNHNETTLDYLFMLNGSPVTSIKDAGTYTVNVKAKETANYLAANASFTFTVEAINPETPTVNLVATYDDLLSSITLPSDLNGKWVWKETKTDPNAKVGNVGTQQHIIVFESNTSNYLAAEVTVNVVVNPKQLEITITKNTFSYDGLPHSVEYTTPVPGLAVTGNDEQTNVGKYPVTITIVDSNYVGSITTELIINKGTFNLQVNDGGATQALNNNVVIDKDYVRNGKLTLTVTDINGLSLSELEVVGYKDALMSRSADGKTITLEFNGYGTYVLTFTTSNNYNGIATNITFNIYIVEATTSTTFGTGSKYTSLGEALEATKNATTKTYIRPFGNVTLDSFNGVTNYTIGKNVVLYIPHEARTSYAQYNKDSDLTNGYVKPVVFDTVTISASLTINLQGTIEIGSCRDYGQPYSNRLSKAYSKIINNGVIICNQGSLFMNLGIIEGSGLLELLGSSKFVEPITINNWRGGTNASGVYPKGIVPFSDYQVSNTRCTLKVNSNASFTAVAFMIADNKYKTCEYNIIGNGAIIEVSSTVPNSYIIKKYNSTTQVQHGENVGVNTFEIYGVVKDNAGVLNVGVAVNTGSCLFPLIYRTKIIVKTGAKFTLTQQYKALPGFEGIIEEGATLEIQNNFAIYGLWNDKGFKADNVTWIYPHNLSEPKIINNGTINVTSSGRIGGKITSIVNTSKIIYNSSVVNVKSQEGYAVRQLLWSKFHETDNFNLVLTNTDGTQMSGNKTYTFDGNKWV